MKHTTDYLDMLKTSLGITSDYGLAKVLEVSTGNMSMYRSGARVMDDYTCAKLAERLGVNPMEVIAAANCERDKDPEKREFWTNLYATVTGTLAPALATMAASSTLTSATTGMKRAPTGKPIEALKQWRKGGDSNPR
ncbi:hypothetical protein GCM10007907_24860 [Chitinimonas prasina]|uniref:XRE family transcriptional regulator n=1 Tax=Chitinimonas prasina TaxID=1434937 RepID=A0ABQ5YK91_9NEIS|nr:hypothetical protein [Chitinimonas prasina]GLR13696.1 hypothetical protein GCM10007907_24860 [Chitinimonas prasina]